MELKISPDIKSIYDCPIETTIGQIHAMISRDYIDNIFRAVGQVGIEINEKGLVEAINQDKKRYVDNN